MATIAEKVADLAAFDVIRFAQKANSNIAILDRLRRLGVVRGCGECWGSQKSLRSRICGPGRT